MKTVSVDGLKGWERVEELDGLLVSKILANYAPYIRDELGVGGFIQKLYAGGLFYLPKQAWVLLDGFVNEGSLCFHGGKFTQDSVDEEVAHLLDFVMEQSKVKALTAYIPEHAESAINFVKRLGLVPMGSIPFDAHYGGELKSTFIYVKIKE